MPLPPDTVRQLFELCRRYFLDTNTRTDVQAEFMDRVLSALAAAALPDEAEILARAGAQGKAALSAVLRN
jgi:hypothetical protein